MNVALHWIDWSVVAAYMAAMIFLGWRAGRGNKSLSDYFVGGRNVGGFAAGISLVATLLSTVTYLAYPGEVIAHGAGFLWQIVALPVVYVVVGYCFIPHIMSLPVSSAYELLEARLGMSIRMLAASLFLLLRLIWMAFILHTACTAMSVIVGVPREWLMLGMWTVTLIYTMEGGIRAVIWTDVAQFFVLLAGAIFTFVYLMGQNSIGVGELVDQGWNSMMQTPLFSVDPNVRTTAVGWIVSVGVWWIATCGSDQVAMQRFFTNRDAAVARRTLAVNLVASATSIVALAAIGLTLLHYYSRNLDSLPSEYQDLTAASDRIFPFFIRHAMPVGLSGIVIAALLAAAMSSLSSGFNSLTTVLTVDFFNRNAAAKSHETVLVADRRRAQLITLVIGVLAFAIAYPLKFAQDTFIGLSSRLMEPLTGPLFGLFALAFFARRANGASAWIGFVSGLSVAYFFAFGHVALGREMEFSFLWILPSSIAATYLVGMIASHALRGHAKY